MRITQSMLASNSLKHLSESYRRMGKYEDQLATGKKITKPSDDPVVAMKGMYYRSNLTEVEQYKRNLSELYLWMDNSEAGIDQANSALQRVRELTIQGMNDSNSPDDRKAIAREVEQLKQSLAATANTQVGGRYIFHGTDVLEPTVKIGDKVEVAENLYKDEIDNYQVEVSRGVFMKANVDPAKVFNQEMFDTVQKIQDQLDSGDPQELDKLLNDLDKAMNTLSAERSELGARYNRLEMMENRLGQQEVMATKILSDNEDADIERVIMDLKSQESVHRAALSVSARIIQPTLMDFLR
ncbi:flagellar hook-associated protein FlgL [Mesobacillus selenatarsenatis]|uniref:Flagellar hook-associated protein FlgL n=1 Tax=Mesobacillus selenatarsenatis TaxID=388741 RepID=A0A846TIM8_9BACI|nr:flagellar hook-associated protein FlgL [Mesobacillus selenatarsenatis]NKE06800.1 flagellar hook-associated protein FlgL [Mesobacillus selenatarsenatis]